MSQTEQELPGTQDVQIEQASHPETGDNSSNNSLFNLLKQTAQKNPVLTFLTSAAIGFVGFADGVNNVFDLKDNIFPGEEPPAITQEVDQKTYTIDINLRCGQKATISANDFEKFKEQVEFVTNMDNKSTCLTSSPDISKDKYIDLPKQPPSSPNDEIKVDKSAILPRSNSNTDTKIKPVQINDNVDSTKPVKIGSKSAVNDNPKGSSPESRFEKYSQKSKDNVEISNGPK